MQRKIIISGNFIQEKERHGGAIACGEVIRVKQELTTGGNLNLRSASVNEDVRNEGYITNIDVGRVARRDGSRGSRAGGRCRRRCRRRRRGGSSRPRWGVIILSVDEDGDEESSGGSSQRDGELHRRRRLGLPLFFLCGQKWNAEHERRRLRGVGDDD